MGDMDNTTTLLYSPCSGSLRGPSSLQCLEYNGYIITCNMSNAWEAFIGPSDASNTMKSTMIWLYLQCYGGLCGPSNTSNTMENTMRSNTHTYDILEAFTGLSSASNTIENNIVASCQMWRAQVSAEQQSRKMSKREKKNHYARGRRGLSADLPQIVPTTGCT